MTRRDESMGRAYFDALYARDPDPWRFASSAYEREKYAASLAALPGGRFGQALEVGCSIAVFTALLARRCDTLLALDVAEDALDQARAGCTATNVRFENRRVPDEWPAGTFDLIVLSEVLYYLMGAEVARVGGLVRAALGNGGTVLLVHYLGETDYPMSGDDAAAAFIEATGLPVVRQVRAPGYRIDVLSGP